MEWARFVGDAVVEVEAVVVLEVAVEVESGGMNLFCWRCHQMEKMCRCKERNHDGIKFHFLLTSRRHSFFGGEIVSSHYH